MMQAESAALPEGWTRHEMTGRTFYYHKATNTTSNELPAAATQQRSSTSIEQVVAPDGFTSGVMPSPCPLQAVASTTEPLLPTVAISVDSADVQASKRGWIAYGISLACCCFCSGFACVFSPAVWLVLAVKHFAKSPQERERFPKQRTVACTALTTCLATSCVTCLVLAGGIGFGTGFGMATLANIEADLESVAGSCASIKTFEQAACPDGFMDCQRWPAQSERNDICADVSNGTCKEAVQDRSVKEVFDHVCDDRMWHRIREMDDDRDEADEHDLGNKERNHFLGRHRTHNLHHGHHWHQLLNRGHAIQYAEKSLDGGNLDAEVSTNQASKPHHGCLKKWFHKKWLHGKKWFHAKKWFHGKQRDAKKSEFQV